MYCNLTYLIARTLYYLLLLLKLRNLGLTSASTDRIDNLLDWSGKIRWKKSSFVCRLLDTHEPTFLLQQTNSKLRLHESEYYFGQVQLRSDNDGLATDLKQERETSSQTI